LGYIKDINKNEISIRVSDKIYKIPLSEIEVSGDLIIRVLEINWQYVNNYWEKGNVKFKHLYNAIYETFEEKQWDFLNVQNKSVLDIGAFVGDSPIYFILKGAKRVYAIEPHPDAYNEMLENIKLNNMEDKIIPINIGINYDNGYVSIYKSVPDTQGALLKPEKKVLKHLQID